MPLLKKFYVYILKSKINLSYKIETCAYLLSFMHSYLVILRTKYYIPLIEHKN